MAFDTVLIANRGEIACRIIETARKMGFRTVAVFSDADADARHVAMADVARNIGPADPASSYLNTDAIIDAAKATGAGAIHPGYGFLSENPDFVDALDAAGIVFVGPSAKAIRAMGLKDAAKALMEEAGVPVVPGYAGDDQTVETLSAQADEIGYPVLIKAVAGGGGKGMRRVDTPGAFAEALASATAEARTAFGNDRVLIEKFIAKPRHIEVQVFGDGETAVHLFERDCSLQRRHQKVIEEAPAPGMTAKMRAAMGQAAVRAAEAVGYKGAGTVEFIVDASDGLRENGFWFMEMNTRLQVEHPVTEAITGVDIVEWQLRVAQGESLPAAQDELSITGHAIEARVYAEDTGAGFLPATGRLAHLVFPLDARIDTGVRAGDEITPHYDPMIAKVTVHGATRDEALRGLTRALKSTDIAGTTTNIGFLTRLSELEAFVSADLDTGIIDRAGPDLALDPAPGSETKALAAITALKLDKSQPHQAFQLWTPLRHHLKLGDTELIVTPKDDGGNVTIDGQTFSVSRTGGAWCVEGQKTNLRTVLMADSVAVFGDGGGVFDLEDPLARGAGGKEDGALDAPMPGKVTAVHVTAGQNVTAGERLVTLEAMKMEHALRAPNDGVVETVLVRADDQVVAGQMLVVMEASA